MAVALSTVPDNRGWFPVIREKFAGAWQRNQEWTADSVLAHHAVFACTTLVSSDVGKLRAKLMEQGADNIWSETSSPSFSPVLRKPNRYQNHIQFKEQWITSKLLRGNAYALKQRDARGVVVALYLLDPSRVRVLVAPDGSVFYDLSDDNLSGLEAKVVPASEIIHDRMNCLFHPLVGLSPIFACGIAANMGLNIERNGSAFFGNDSTPGGILTAPGTINDVTATRLKEQWETNYGGENVGRVAVLGDGLKFEPMRMTAVDAQMIEHLKFTAETVCSAFHVPPFKIGAGAMPTYSNGELLDQRYYSDCLQSHIESFELCMDEGLGIGEGVKTEGRTIGVELDLEGLLRMDTATHVKTLGDGIRAGLFAPNEARARIDLKPLKGGNTVYLQHQDYPMEMVFERTDLNAPEPSSAPVPAPTPTPTPENKAFDFSATLELVRQGLRAA